jgi:hypothetical protein
MNTRPVRSTAMLAICAGLLLAAVPLQSQARPGGGGGGGGGAGWNSGGAHHGGGHYGGGHYGGHYGHWGGYWGGYWGPAFWGGWGLGIGFGAGCYGYYGYCGGYYLAPGYAVAPGWGGYVIADPAGGPVVRSTQPVPAAAPAPDPIFYPRNGQTPAQVETDRQDCNRWATTQSGAMNDASIFQRATLACMEGRGYTVR